MEPMRPLVRGHPLVVSTQHVRGRREQREVVGSKRLGFVGLGEVRVRVEPGPLTAGFAPPFEPRARLRTPATHQRPKAYPRLDSNPPKQIAADETLTVVRARARLRPSSRRAVHGYILGGSSIRAAPRRRR